MTTTTATFNGVQFTDKDVVNPDDFIPQGEYNPHDIHGFLFHDHGFALAVVFASSLGDALDIAADEGKLDRFRATSVDTEDYDNDGLSFLGNAGEPFDLESLGVEELPNPPMSFTTLFLAQKSLTYHKTLCDLLGLSEDVPDGVLLDAVQDHKVYRP